MNGRYNQSVVWQYHWEIFILSGVISPLFSSSILGTYWPGEFIFQCPIFLSFHTVHGVLKVRILKWFAKCWAGAQEQRQNENHNHRKLTNLITWTTALSNSMKLWAMPCGATHGGEFWQNVVHWRREWQTTSVFLPWEPHEQHEKAK